MGADHGDIQFHNEIKIKSFGINSLSFMDLTSHPKAQMTMHFRFLTNETITIICTSRLSISRLHLFELQAEENSKKIPANLLRE